jgi:hypothetical protein
MKTGVLPVLPGTSLPLPASLASLLAVSGPLFTAPSFRTFTALACGFLAQTGKRTVCGMLAGAGLSRAWPHDRAHWFFARARWSAGELGLAAATLVVALLVPDRGAGHRGDRRHLGQKAGKQGAGGVRVRPLLSDGVRPDVKAGAIVR